MDELTFDDYLHLVASELSSNHPTLRAGQAYFNVLQVRRPDLADEVSKRPWLDPFYATGQLDVFLEYLGEVW